MSNPACPVSSLAAPTDQDGGIVVPGRNCWRAAHASRFAVATHVDAQKRALRQGILGATRTVFIAGWHVDSQTRLGTDQDDAWPQQLGQLLHALLLQRPLLRVYVLAWDFCMLYSGEREWPPVYRQQWPHHRRLVHRLDARHPAGGAHHQNFVVIDDSLAFVGGLDLARDTRSGAEASSVHPGSIGAQAVFDGEAAALMGELARARWERSAGRRVASARRRGSHLTHIPLGEAAPWPPSLMPDIYDVSVAISRTEPAYAGRPAVGEIRQLFVDAISGARRHLYFEHGYFTSQAVSQALAARMGRPEAPEAVLVTQQGAAGWLDEAAMQSMRAEIHAQLKGQDTGERYSAFCPVAAPDDPNTAASVRSRVFIADDNLICLGSANISNRSMLLDTECQVSVQAAGQAPVREGIAAIRNRLLAARLGVPADAIAAKVAEAGIAGAIAHFDPAGLALTRFEPQDARGAQHDTRGLWVDRERPVSPERLIDQFMSDVEQPSWRRRLLVGVAIVAVMFAVAAVWRWTPLSDYLNLGVLLKLGYQLKALPYAFLAILGCYVVGGLIAMPVTVLIAASGMVFGAWQGGIYALVGTMLSALVTYALGRWLGRDTVRSLAGPRINAISERIATRGLLAMVVLRVLPVAPFTVVNVMAGASHIKLRDYLAGTFLGMLPGIVITVAFANQLAKAMVEPDLESISLVTGAGVLMVMVAWGIQRLAKSFGGEAGRPARPGRDGSSTVQG